MKKILIIVDMQKDFVDGALGTKEAVSIVPNVIEKIKKYDRLDDAMIITTQDTHYDSYLLTQEGKKLPVKHCIKDTDGWKLDEKIAYELSKVNNCTVVNITKPTFGSFALGGYLAQYAGRNVQIELVGLCTDICVISNAIIAKSVLPEANIFVDAACCAGVTPESHERALDALAPVQIDVINRNQEAK